VSADTGETGASLMRLDEITRRLRRECPWDREQDERTIVPHTVEEAYELADAANAGDDSKMLDELGDVLFQVYFLSLLLEERGQGDLASVAEHCRQKLIRRHPHVFGDTLADDAATVLRNWDAIKADERGGEGGVFADVPENLPATLYARKLQRRAASAGHERPSAEQAAAELRDALEAIEPEDAFERLGEILWHAVALARAMKVDPELALRSAANRFKETIE
jgi:MazG family protein